MVSHLKSYIKAADLCEKWNIESSSKHRCGSSWIDLNAINEVLSIAKNCKNSIKEHLMQKNWYIVEMLCKQFKNVEGLNSAGRALIHHGVLIKVAKNQ